MLILFGLCFSLFMGDASVRPITATGVEYSEPNDTHKAHYRAVLERLDRDDQKYRVMISWGTTDPDELEELQALDDEAHMAEWARRRSEGIRLDPEEDRELRALQSDLDFYITRVLMGMVERFGWPSEELLGPGTPDMTPVLIHMHTDDAAWALPILRREVLSGRMRPKLYGMIHDRTLQNSGEPQLYGTVLLFDPSTNGTRPPAVEDIDATNAARAEIGLEPLTAYTIIGED